MPRIFIIGDIHGCSKTFKKMVLDEIKIAKTDKLYCLGDFIDRGPDSKGVIDFILSMRKKGYHIHTLKGNHEAMLLKSVEDENSFSHWIRNGGEATLKSFKIKSVSQLDEEYLQFFKRTKYYIRTKDFFLVHAGLNFNIPNPLTDKRAMLWLREYEVDTSFLNGRLLIHGHTAVSVPEILSQKFDKVVNLDGGCVYTKKEGCGSLIALNFYEKKFLEVKNID